MIIIFAYLAVSSCSSNSGTSTSVNVDTTEHQESATSVPQIFGIEGDNIIIRTGPGKNFPGIVNEKASEAIGITEYCQVDNSVKVVVLETKEKWTKIKVVEPEWLSDSHVGWILSKSIITEKDQKAQEIGKLNSKDYQILITDHRPAVQNFHVWLKRKKFDKNYVYQFSKAFRKEYCTQNCNIDIYDSNNIKSLIGIYPLEGKAYLKMADHLISFSSFDATEVRDWYPYQDFHYKELGGKNWKKDPIK
jgi:hypothetical protein